MKGLLQPKPRKPVGTLSNELKGFFEPVNRLTKPASPAEIQSDSEYKPPAEREWKYLMTEPIFEKGLLQPPRFRGYTATADNTNQKTPSMNQFRVSNLKNQFEENFTNDTRAETAETRSRPSSRSIESNSSQLQAREGRISHGKDADSPRYANSGSVEDWVEEVRAARDPLVLSVTAPLTKMAASKNTKKARVIRARHADAQRKNRTAPFAPTYPPWLGAGTTCPVLPAPSHR